MTSSPEPGRSLAAHLERLTAMMQAMDADQKAYEEWLLRVDADVNGRIAATEDELAVIRTDTNRRIAESDLRIETIRTDTDRRIAESDLRIEAMRTDTDRRIEAIRAESVERYRAHLEWVQAMETQVARHHETIKGLLDGLVQAQADISRLDAAS